MHNYLDIALYLDEQRNILLTLCSLSSFRSIYFQSYSNSFRYISVRNDSQGTIKAIPTLSLPTTSGRRVGRGLKTL
jgi:hypothetical protein